MSAARATVRFLVLVAVLLLAGACDDDDDVNKTPRYDVTILISEHIDIEPNGDTIIKIKPERRFKKPRIEVHTPEGVDVVKVPRPKRKGTVYDFAPIALPAIIILVLVAALRSGCVHPARLKLQV